MRLPEKWCHIDEAAQLVKRTPRTIRYWAHQGHVRYRLTPKGREYEAGSLLQAKKAARDRRQYFNWKPGPGRPPHQARPQIRTLLAEGQKPVDIAQQLNCSTYLVYRVRRELKGTT